MDESAAWRVLVAQCATEMEEEIINKQAPNAVASA